MKVTLRELADSADALNNLLSTPIKAGVAFRIGRAAKIVQEHLGVLQETAQKAREKHGIETAQEALNHAEYNIEIGELLDESVEIDVDKIKVSALGDIDVTPRDMLLLDWLIEA